MIVDVKALKLTQQIGDFFIATIPADDLVRLTFTDVRTLQEERDVETYLGIQRRLDRKRAKDIHEYVKNFDAAFPSSVILSIEQEHVTWNERDNKLSIDCSSISSPAKILDGQHRIAGFMDLDTGKPIEDVCFFDRNSEKVPFELMVTIFVGLDLPEQANIFATVNLKQTKVSKSLVYDLEAYTKTRSPQKTAHDIVVALDLHEKSPFYGRVKRLGYKEGAFETITQAMLVEEVVKLISKKPMEDRDILLRNEKKSFSSLRSEKLERYSWKEGRVFRDFFIDNQDELIMKTILTFFKSVSERWPNAWDARNKESVLNKTVGIKALFRVMKDICMAYFNEMPGSSVPEKLFQEKLLGVDVEDGYFDKLDATSATASKVYQMISKEL